MRIHGMHTLPDQYHVVQGRNNRKQKGRPQKSFSCNRHPYLRMYQLQHNKKYGSDLGKCVCLAKNTGTKVAQPSGDIERRADDNNTNVTCKNHYRIFPGNVMQNRKHRKHGAEEQFVRHWIEILSDFRLLFQRSREQTIKAVAESS